MNSNPEPCSENNVQLREYLELRISQLEARLHRELELREQARGIQATEYERRLSVLNHAHERAVVEQARVLPRELFDVFKADYERFKMETIAQLSAIATRAVTWTTAVGLFFTIVVIALQFLKK